MKISLMIFLLVVTGCKPQGPPPGPPFASPLKSDVQSIAAHLGQAKSFDVPKSSFEPILNSLNGAAEDNNPMKWGILGYIEITHNSGKVKVGLFSTREAIGAFRVDNVYYRGSSDEELKRIIETARKNKREQNAAEQPATATQSKSK